jgi:uncharacterized protein
MSPIIEEPMEARQSLEFPYTHSTGPVIGRFLAGLKEQGVIWGRRTKGLGVVVPPLGYSELDGGNDEDAWVQVADRGVVTAFAKVRQPLEGLHPCATPFAFVLIKLEGADTPMPHIVTEGLDRLKVGSRVVATWKPVEERIGSIKDIANFRFAE